MIKLAISNLAWGAMSTDAALRQISQAGIEGVEIAPSLLWENYPEFNNRSIEKFKRMTDDNGIQISGIQSLLYKQEDFSIFDRGAWNHLYSHLEVMIDLAAQLGAGVAVFGAPKNRQRGGLDTVSANQIAQEFFEGLIPILESYEIVLTLEPNAPKYGADFAITYSEVVAFCRRISSDFLKPQIDTGCMHIVNENLVEALDTYIPTHIHISSPDLLELPGPIDHRTFSAKIKQVDYKGWITLEMLEKKNASKLELMATCAWFTENYLPR